MKRIRKWIYSFRLASPWHFWIKGLRIRGARASRWKKVNGNAFKLAKESNDT